MQESLLFFSLLFVIASLYASVGHGGASGYLALMAIFAISPLVMKPTALLLNLFVSSISFVQFYRGGHFKPKIFWPFVITSVPLSFLGGTMAIESNVYKKILGVLLLIPVVRFFAFSNNDQEEQKKTSISISFLIGGLIGLLSGMIGIGGGIILSPILILLKWTNQKQTATISAAFIFVNSIAGLAGQFVKGIAFTSDMAFYVLIAFLGGILGSYLGSLKFPQIALKYVLAFVLALASYKLLFTSA